MITRRGFLSGVGGAALALPFLESVSFLGRRARADGNAKAPVFSVFIRQGCGVQQGGAGEPERFWPRNLGQLSTAALEVDNADRALSELASYADKLLLVRGTRFGFPGNNCGHSGGLNQCLTAARVTGVGKDSLASGESIDWFLAKRLNPGKTDPLTLMSGPQTAYLAHGLSYSGPQQLRGAQNNPFAVYKKIIGLGDVPGEVLESIAQRRVSVNDLVREEMREFLAKPNLASADRTRLQYHFDSIRDLEVSMACKLADDRVSALEAIGDEAAQNKNRVVVTKMMMDLIAMAFACDSTRVATLQIGEGNDQTQYTIDGEIQNTYHRISHRIDNDGGMGGVIANADILHHKIDRMFAGMYKYLLDRLSEYTGPSGGPLLDDSIALWTNDLANGPPHSYDNIPQVVAGGAGGALKTGQYIDAGNSTHNKFLNSLITAAGIRAEGGGPYDQFGDESLERGVISAMLT